MKMAKPGNYAALLANATRAACFTILLVGMLRPSTPQARGDEITWNGGLPAVNHADAMANASYENQVAWPQVDTVVMDETPTSVIGASYVSSEASDGSPLWPGKNITFKLGGYVKGDFIHDFDAIESQDNFSTPTIFTDGRDGENTRLHARQTRLNLDARWPTDAGQARIFVEGDFFGAGSTFRLRHAYGEIGRWLVGQTWTTATDIDALPSTLDFESPNAFIVLRRAMIRWTYESSEQLKFAFAVEDPRVIFPLEDELPSVAIFAEEREPWPDFVGRVRYTADRWQFQFSGLLHTLGSQRPGESIQNETGYGFQLAGYWETCESHKFKYQVGFGNGVGGLRGITEAVPNNRGGIDLLDVFGATAGYEIEWTDRWKSTVVYSHGRLNNSPLQEPDAIHAADYLAVNLVWNPAERVHAGIEYLNGKREDFGGASGEVNRIQMSVWYSLP